MDPYEAFEQAHRHHRPLVTMHTPRDKMVYVVEVDAQTCQRSGRRSVRQGEKGAVHAEHVTALHMASDATHSSSSSACCCPLTRHSSRRHEDRMSDEESEGVEYAATELALRNTSRSSCTRHDDEDTDMSEEPSLTRAPVSACNPSRSSSKGSTRASEEEYRWCEADSHNHPTRPGRERVELHRVDSLKEVHNSGRDGSNTPDDATMYRPNQSALVQRLLRILQLSKVRRPVDSANGASGESSATRDRSDAGGSSPAIPCQEEEQGSSATGGASDLLEQIAHVREHLNATHEQIRVTLAEDRKLGNIWSDEHLRNKNALRRFESLMARLDKVEKVHRMQRCKP